jgi:Protein of unknown function (DUF3224)
MEETVIHTPTARHRRTAGAVSATVLVAVGAIAPSISHAEPAHHGPTHRLEWNYIQQPAVVSAPLCDPSGACVVPFTVLGQSTDGDVIGTSVQAGSAVRLPDGSLYANSTLMFTGTIGQCGSGTVAMRSTGFNRAGATSGDIFIVASSGTGELDGITGIGHVIDGHVDPATGLGLGTIELDVRCLHR